MGIVTGNTITLEQSITENSPKKYRGYVIGCNDTHVYDGTWSPNTSVTGIGVSVSDSVLSVWNTNSTTEDVSREFEWTSSKLSTCIKTITVVAKGIEETVVTLQSGNTELLIICEYNGVSNNLNIQGAIDQILINGSSNGITVNRSSLGLGPIISCNGNISQYWINYGESLGGNYSSGYIYISLNPDLGSDLIGCTSNYTSSGGLTLNINYNGKSITKTIPVKCNINYNASYKWYFMHNEAYSVYSEITYFNKTVTSENSFEIHDFLHGCIVCYNGEYEYNGSTPNYNKFSTSFSAENKTNITLNNTTWGLSDLLNKSNYYVKLITPTTLATKLNNLTSSFEYNITGNIISQGLTLPVSITYKKNVVETITSKVSFSIEFYNNLYGEYDGDLYGFAMCSVGSSSWTSNNLSCSPGNQDGSSSISYTISGNKGTSYTVTYKINVAIDYYGNCPNIEFSDTYSDLSLNIGYADNITCPNSRQTYEKTFSTTLTLDGNQGNPNIKVTVDCNR